MLILNELCEGGTLWDLIDKYDGVLPENKVLAIFREVVAGVKHMHTLGIAHRDIKVENVVKSTVDGKYKLCDFGSASSETLDYQTASKS